MKEKLNLLRTLSVPLLCVILKQSVRNKLYLAVHSKRNGRIEEIDVYLRDDGTQYKTSADYCTENHPAGLREEIINMFNKLY